MQNSCHSVRACTLYPYYMITSKAPFMLCKPCESVRIYTYAVV